MVVDSHVLSLEIGWFPPWPFSVVWFPNRMQRRPPKFIGHRPDSLPGLPGSRNDARWLVVGIGHPSIRGLFFDGHTGNRSTIQRDDDDDENNDGLV